MIEDTKTEQQPEARGSAGTHLLGIPCSAICHFVNNNSHRASLLVETRIPFAPFVGMIFEPLEEQVGVVVNEVSWCAATGSLTLSGLCELEWDHERFSGLVCDLKENYQDVSEHFSDDA